MLGKWKKTLSKIFLPPAKLIGRILPPNAITLLGFILGILTAITYTNIQIPWIGWLFAFTYAPLWFMIATIMDALDGAAARYYNKVTKFGGVLDSTLDRCVDAILIFAMIHGNWVSIEWGILAIITSYLISYVRARAEAAGAEMMGKGLMERGERLILIFIATVIAAWGPWWGISPYITNNILEWTIIAIVLLGTITVIQRLYAAWKSLSKNKDEK